VQRVRDVDAVSDVRDPEILGARAVPEQLDPVEAPLASIVRPARLRVTWAAAIVTPRPGQLVKSLASVMLVVMVAPQARLTARSRTAGERFPALEAV